MPAVRLFVRVFLPLVFQPHGRHRMRVALAGLALATAVRVVDRVHHDAAHRRADAAPALGARLAVAAQVVFVVADFADRGAAVDVHLAHLGRAQADRARTCLRAPRAARERAGAARDLAALAGLQLDVVDLVPIGMLRSCSALPGLIGESAPETARVARRHALGGDDVAALAVRVQHQREVRGAVRIVFEALDAAAAMPSLSRRKSIDAVAAACDRRPCGAWSGGRVVARAGRLLAGDEGAHRAALVQVRAVGSCTWKRRPGEVGFDLISAMLTIPSGCRGASGCSRQRNRCSGLGQPHIGLLEVLPAAGRGRSASPCPAAFTTCTAVDLDLEHQLDGGA